MIRVEPVTLEWMEALAAGDDVFAAWFGVPVLEGWAGFPEAVHIALESARRGDTGPWGSHLIFDHDGSLVGFAGWKGAPVDGVVELGYAVGPARQGQGIATSAVQVLIVQAGSAGIKSVIAHTLPEASASTGGLKRCGFTYTSDVADPDGQVEGVVWRWGAHGMILV